MNKQQPLRYKISSWRQLVNCKSNNSRDLHISVVDFFNNVKLRGFRISVEHPRFGVLFATVLEARGVLVTDQDEYGRSELFVEAILSDLEKYGFLITSAPEENVSSGQLEYLMTLNKLSFDKLRIVHAWDTGVGEMQWHPMIVAFQSDPLGNWLNNAYSPSKSEIVEALMAGTAINLTDISKTRQYRWDWLKDKIVSIDDVIKDNANQMIRFEDPNEDDNEEVDSNLEYLDESNNEG